MLTSSITTLALLTGLGVPTAYAADPPSILAADVQLAWVDGKVRVTWTETASAPNTISLERDGLDDLRLGTTTIDQPNQFVVEPFTLPVSHRATDIGRIVVSEPSGDEARSADFDRYVRGDGEVTFSFAPDGGLRWSFPPDTTKDLTPNDPLDVDEPTRYIANLLVNEKPYTVDQCREVALPAVPTPSGVIANRNKPYDLRLSAKNEWTPYGSPLAWVRVRTSSVTMNAPAATQYGTSITLSGLVKGRYIWEHPAPPPVCEETDINWIAGAPVVLQARNTSTSPWYVVGSTTTGAKGQYSFVVRNTGGREYRTVTPNRVVDGTPQYGSISASKLVRATTRVVSAKFITPTITYGQKPNAYLWVEPPGSQRAALQFRNPSGVWQGLMYKTLSSGRGLTGPFTFNRRGVTPFRWWVPGSTTGTGLKVDPVYSGTFSLTMK